MAWMDQSCLIHHDGCRARRDAASSLDVLYIFKAFGNHAMTMTRRDFLSASAALAAAPVLGARAGAVPLPREADIVVSGAGAAGLAAGRRIIAANRKAIVVEATDRSGRPA